MTDYKEITSCRICGNTELAPIISLGNQALTGVFPKTKDKGLVAGPLDLIRCVSKSGTCGLVQLRQSYDNNLLYGSNYGYHSNLNRSMVEHLRSKVEEIQALVPLGDKDLVIDIGSNDGTFLSAFARGPRLVGIDPTGEQFQNMYPKHVELISDFFSAKLVRERVGDRKAKVISSIAMFYDLDSPMIFVEEIRDLLADDGIWVVEQSYLPSMIRANAYDTICHEHLEYYGLRQIKWMTDRAGLAIVDVHLNNINGGSFSVVAAKHGSPIPAQEAKIEALLKAEEAYTGTAVYTDFQNAVYEHRHAMRAFFDERRSKGESVLGYGASTKGNVILQFCEISANDLPAIGDVNPDKFGCFTPGTHIPIIPEAEISLRKPDYIIVLPWHFKEFFVRKERAFLQSGGKLFFPLPIPHVCQGAAPA